MAGELNPIPSVYCNCKNLCRSEGAPRARVPKDIDYAVIRFGETPDKDKIIYWAGPKDIQSILSDADEREICVGSNIKILDGVKKILSGPYRAVTLRKTGQEGGKELEKYFHFFSELPHDSPMETGNNVPGRQTSEKTCNLLRIPLYDEHTGSELDADAFIRHFKKRVIKGDDNNDSSYYSSLICRTVSGIAGTNCFLIEKYADSLIEGKGHETCFDEDALFNEQLGAHWKRELQDTDRGYINLGAIINFNNDILAEESSVSLLLKEKIKPDKELIDRAKKLKEDKARLNIYRNAIIGHLQQELISAYSEHPDIKAINAEQKSICERLDLAKKKFDESIDRSLEYFLHLYQLADLELPKNGDPAFSIAHSICDKVGGEEHHKLHEKADKNTHKVLLTNLDTENPGHWPMYMEKYRGLVDAIVLFRKRGK